MTNLYKNQTFVISAAELHIPSNQLYQAQECEIPGHAIYNTLQVIDSLPDHVSQVKSAGLL